MSHRKRMCRPKRVAEINDFPVAAVQAQQAAVPTVQFITPFSSRLRTTLFPFAF
jgi:hypothetical protein